MLVIRTAIFSAAVAALVATSSVAFARNDIVVSQDKRLVFTVPQATKFNPTFVRKPKSATIYSNLAAAYPKGLYFSGEGSSIFGGSSAQFVAAGFTPTANATAAEVQAAVGEFGDGKSSYTLSIYSDKAGIPDQPLSSVIVTSTTPFGTCCGLITAKLKSGLALKGGTPYWVAITLDKKQLAALDDGAWNLATVNQVDNQPFAYNPNNTGWVSSPTILPPAFAVYSK